MFIWVMNFFLFFFCLFVCFCIVLLCILPPPLYIFCICWVHAIFVLYCAHLCMKCSLGISDFLDETSSYSHSIIFLYFFALMIEEGFLISPCYSLEFGIQTSPEQTRNTGLSVSILSSDLNRKIRKMNLHLNKGPAWLTSVDWESPGVPRIVREPPRPGSSLLSALLSSFPIWLLTL